MESRACVRVCARVCVLSSARELRLSLLRAQAVAAAGGSSTLKADSYTGLSQAFLKIFREEGVVRANNPSKFAESDSRIFFFFRRWPFSGMC